MVRRKPAAIARCHSGYRHTIGRLSEYGWLPMLLLRLSIGFMFFSGAVDKLRDLGKFTAMFTSLGIPAAPVVAPLVAVVELVGGVALMLGLGTRPVSLVLAMDMIGALLTDIGPGLADKYPSVWSFASNLFYSSEWLLTGLLLYLLCAGGGPASIDAATERRRMSAR